MVGVSENDVLSEGDKEHGEEITSDMTIKTCTQELADAQLSTPQTNLFTV